MFPEKIRELLWAYVLLSLGGLMLHIRIHPPAESLFNAIPALLGLLNTFILPFLFCRAATAPLAFMLCCITVIAGDGGMAYHSLVTWKGPVTLYAVLFTTTFPDILILTMKLPLGYALLKHYNKNLSLPSEGVCSDE